MKSLVLIYNNPAASELFAGMPAEERQRAFQVYFDIESELAGSGELVDSKAVDDQSQMLVRRGPDGPVVTAAPLPETADVVSGYYIVDVADEARAYEIAARFPEAAVDGGIRVARALTQDDFDALGM